MKFISVLISLPLSGAALGSRPACAQGATDVAFVEDMNGRVVASSQQGKPFLLQTLDTINDRTQLDILANGEVRVCHYQTRTILIYLIGPKRRPALTLSFEKLRQNRLPSGRDEFAFKFQKSM
jgi:hypothetical protein